MRKSRKICIVQMLFVMVCLVGISFTVKAPVKAAESFKAVYNVKNSSFGAKSGKDSTKAIQKALDKAAKNAKAGKRVQVYIPAGTYYITKTLNIDSNVYLKCHKKAKIVKKSKKVLYMLRSKKHGKKSYNNVKNITVSGGSWDAKFLKYNKKTGGSLFFFAHAEGIQIQNLTLKNNYGTHLIEFGGVKNALVSGCRLYGFKASSTGSDKEAIQLDVCHNYEILPDGKPYDDTPCSDITIENNEIYNYPRAIGSHSLVKDIYPDKIRITGNKIHDISENAIYAYNYTNLTVSGNTFKNVYGGVVYKTYAEAGKNTIFNRNKDVAAMTLPESGHNVVISNNTISTKNMSIKDNRMQIGIFVYGTDAYKVKGIRIDNNRVTSSSTGIYLRYVQSGNVTANSCERNNNSTDGVFLVDAYKFLTCSNLTISDNKISGGSNMYENGYAFRDNSTGNTLTNNTVSSVGKHGIAVYGGSSVTITSCTINTVGQHGIAVVDGGKADIDRCQISNCASNGITLVGGYSDYITNNTITNNGATGISVQMSSQVASIKANAISDNGGKAISINASIVTENEN